MWTITVTYFKPSGKYYTSSTYETGQDFMWKIFDEVRQMNIDGKLPGLNGGRWTGPIHIDSHEHPNGYPGLIL